MSSAQIFKPCIQSFACYTECTNNYRFHFHISNTPSPSYHFFFFNLPLQKLEVFKLFTLLSIHSVIPSRRNVPNICLFTLFLNKNNVRFSGLNNIVTLDGHCPQYLTSFIFLYPIPLVCVPLLISVLLLHLLSPFSWAAKISASVSVFKSSFHSQVLSLSNVAGISREN